MTYDTTGKRIRTENLAGQATTTAWDCCHKVYADGKGLKYDYDVHGQLAKRTWARGIDTFYAYNGYLQVSDSLGNVYVWDYTEPIVTRPLVWSHGGEALFYTHDGNKNVSEVVATGDTLAAHYEYAPFGAVTVQTGAFAEPNPWRFSGEYADVEAGGIYFNFRNYTPETGRWFARDPVGEIEGVGIYGFCGNRGYGYCDILGLWSSVWPWDTHQDMVEEALNTISKEEAKWMRESYVNPFLRPEKRYFFP